MSDEVTKRSCNRHDDCDAANAKAKAAYDAGRYDRWWAEHCHDEGCEDCFGK